MTFRSPLAETIARRLDHPGWSLAGTAEDVAVYANRLPGDPVMGYKTVTEHDSSVDSLTRFLGEDLFRAMSLMNGRYVSGEMIRDLGSAMGYRDSIVRTAFTMPRGMKNREFLHRLHIDRPMDHTTIVAYGPVNEFGETGNLALPPPFPGFLRCRVWPSGQRISRLINGRVRVEHLMVYELGGRVSRILQNRGFHRGHVAAYLEEWGRLVELTKDDDGFDVSA